MNNRQRTTPTTTELLEYIGELGKEMTELKKELNELRARTDNGAIYSKRLNERINASARYHKMLEARIVNIEKNET